MKATPLRVDFVDLFEGRGSLAMRYSARAAALSGRPVELEGYLVPVHGQGDLFVLVDAPGTCPDCSAVPIPSIFLPELRAIPGEAAPGGRRMRIRGTLRFGFEIGPRGYASFLRIESATVA